ncbi:uncharacterized protein LOC123501839 [Portunus trituberculatus]|uniref:uncharacterized protein LOC123501839 n=1 Tax=Portunus trituberculatus TaxID=210409 RepID=UPI001E1CB46D|nr:uncharacterized protein LOC123501839 [Portunus trituberculatus]
MALTALLPPPGAAFLPLHQPIMQLPMPRPRAYRGFTTDRLVTPRHPLPHAAALADRRLHDLLAQRDPPGLPVPAAATTTIATTSTTTPASTTPISSTSVTTAAPTTFVRGTSRRSAAPRFVSQFHSGPLQSRKGGDHGDDDGVVLLVGLFNLLAVVVYAAHRHLRAAPHALSERVIQWQVQKVLDELVIKVHSSSYAANLLSRAMPSHAPLTHQHARAAHQDTPWYLLLLRQARALLLHQDPKAGRWLQDARRRLMQDVAASPAALQATTLRPEMYAPIRALYTALATGRAATALEDVLAAAEGGQSRALEGRTPHLAVLLDSLAHLQAPQLRSLLATLTALGRAQQRVDVLPRLSSLLGSVAPAVPIKVRARRATGERGARRGRRIMRRQGKVVEDGAGHWTDRWFSLVTKAAPVGLDLTTLYARARARPTCLRALLCRANNAWRQVGPMQAALTPFTSVALSWLLEDTAPHSLGDSLIAIRAGWMGKPCGSLYPECRLTPDPHPAAKEAITFFSRLQFAATQPKEEAAPPPPTLPNAQQQQQQQQQQGGGGGGDEEGLNTVFIGEDVNTEYLGGGGGGGGGGGDTEEDVNTTSFNLYYTRYGGKGPMTIPGTHYTATHTHNNDSHHHGHHNKLYEKYESPNLSELGEVVPSGSVSGMALQDTPPANSAVTWHHFFNAGLYGTSGQQRVPEEPAGGAAGGGAGGVVVAGRPREHLQHHHHSSQHHQHHQQHHQQTASHKIGVAGRPSLKTQHHQDTPKRPTFLLRPHHHQHHQEQHQEVKKYRYGLRRGLPAGNVNNNKYDNFESTLDKHMAITNDIHTTQQHHQPQKAWYSYTARPDTYQYHHTTTTTTKRPERDIDPFGPQDAVTSVFRNELLYEFVRDRQGYVEEEEEEEEGEVEEEEEQEGRSVR